MRLMIVGPLEGYISEAGKIALRKGVKVTHCESIVQSLNGLRSHGADLVMADVKMDIPQLMESLNTERIAGPSRIVAIGNDAAAAAHRITDSVPVICVRHPSYGGQTQFQRQISELYGRPMSTGSLF